NNFHGHYKAWKENVTPKTSPMEFEKWAKAHERMVSMLARLDRQLTRSPANGDDGRPPDPPEPDEEPTPPAPGLEQQRNEELRQQLRAEAAADERREPAGAAANGHTP